VHFGTFENLSAPKGARVLGAPPPPWLRQGDCYGAAYTSQSG